MIFHEIVTFFTIFNLISELLLKPTGILWLMDYEVLQEKNADKGPFQVEIDSD